MSGLNITIKPCEDGYMVENGGVYFKIGTREGRILEKVVNNEDTSSILEKENITEEQLKQMLDTFREMGVIGRQKKEKNHILFYRIPLFEADRMFSTIVTAIREHKILYKVLFWISVAVVLLGIILMGVYMRDIFNLSVLHLNWMEYVMLYLIFLISVCLHELGHGIVCKYVGGRVGTLGFMLIFFSPAMYCDISGIRMVEDKRKQIMASSAGLYVNLVFMSLGSIAFAIQPRPLFAAFIVMSFTTIISNLIPVIRLDGYWILSFATGITNLYKKSLRGVGKLFTNCSFEERFIAVYGIVTYIFIVIALSSICLSAIGGVQYVLNILV
ncbi:MAG: M50 family metallopeptidase [Lachnospiraceae bacterium]|nr:M50 family metallopeptidase [Lachnospiraceae bacterium]